MSGDPSSCFSPLNSHRVDVLLQGKPFGLAFAHTGFYPFSRDPFPALPQICLHHVGTINKRLLNLAACVAAVRMIQSCVPQTGQDGMGWGGMGVRMDRNVH